MNYLQKESSQFFQIYLSPEKVREMFTFQSYKWLFAKLSKFTKQQLFSLKMVLGCLCLGGLSLNVDTINCLIILEFKTLHNTVQCWKSGVTPLNLLWSDMTWNNYKVNYWFRQKWNRDEAKKIAKSIMALHIRDATSGGAGGAAAPRFWQIRRRRRAAAARRSVPHYYLPPRIFDPCCIPDIYLEFIHLYIQKNWMQSADRIIS